MQIPNMLDRLILENLRTSKPDACLELPLAHTFAEKMKLIKLSEDEYRERIKLHQEKARRRIENAQRVSLLNRNSYFRSRIRTII